MIYTPFRERDADYYDRIYESGYHTGPYRPVHDAVLDFLSRMESPSVLEVGCGTGDMGQAIVGMEIAYRGFDISPVAIEHCHLKGLSACVVASAYDAAVYAPVDYNVILALEVFEHIHDRLAAARFPEGAHVLFSVPNFVETSHLRAYQDPGEDIVKYYKDYMAVERIWPFPFVAGDGQMLTIFLAHATVGAGTLRSP